MSQAATLTRNNQITVPRSVREFLGIRAGERIVFNTNRDTVTLKKEKTAEEVAKTIQSLITDEMRESWQENVGKTAGEIREEWLNSPEAREYYGLGDGDE